MLDVPLMPFSTAFGRIHVNWSEPGELQEFAFRNDGVGGSISFCGTSILPTENWSQTYGSEFRCNRETQKCSRTVRDGGEPPVTAVTLVEYARDYSVSHHNGRPGKEFAAANLRTCIDF